MDSTHYLRRHWNGWLLVIGPWPIKPAQLGFLAFVFVQYGLTIQYRAEGLELVDLQRQAVPRAVAIGVIFFLSFSLLRALVVKGVFGEIGFGRYFILTALATLPTSVVSFMNTNLRSVEWPFFFLRNIFFVLVVLATLGISERRLRTEIAQKERSLALVEDQRALIIEADEIARRSVADFLHDRVQASMVVLSMQLNRLANESAGDVGGQLRSITEELERLRKFELRSASQRLSPDLRIIGLRGALDDLQQFYAAALTLQYNVDDAFTRMATDHADRNLGAYRIIEQAVLNAAAHGQATTCFIDVSSTPDAGWSISVQNDGNRLTEQPQPGAGTAIIDAWVHSLGGEWQISNDDGMVHLQATFPE